MKIGKLFLLLISVLLIGQANAGSWDEIKPYVLGRLLLILFFLVHFSKLAGTILKPKN